MSTKRKVSLVRWMISLIILIPLLFVWMMFLKHKWESYEVISRSMAPTLEIGDRVILKRATEFPNLKGQIIAFKDPTGGDLPLTKRVVADENSSVRLYQGKIYIDNSPEPTDHEPINDMPNNKWEVGPGQVFVMGDNRNESFDSVSFGPIPRSSILGVITYRYWPWARRGKLTP